MPKLHDYIDEVIEKVSYLREHLAEGDYVVNTEDKLSSIIITLEFLKDEARQYEGINK
jgi:hypothetical protein